MIEREARLAPSSEREREKAQKLLRGCSRLLEAERSFVRSRTPALSFLLKKRKDSFGFLSPYSDVRSFVGGLDRDVLRLHPNWVGGFTTILSVRESNEVATGISAKAKGEYTT